MKSFGFRVPGFHRLWQAFPDLSADLGFSYFTGHPPLTSYNPGWVAPSGLGSSHFARRYYGNLFRFLFLQVLRWFTSLRLSSVHY